MNKNVQIQAIELVRSLFESIHGNLGLLKFSIDEMKPINGINGQESKKWEIICSFFKTLGSTKITKYKAIVDIDDSTVIIETIDGEKDIEQEGKYKVTKEEKPAEEKK